MFSKIRTVVTKPAYAFRYVKTLIYFMIRKRRGILFYLGGHRGNGLFPRFRGYEVCHCFEANPDFYALLKKRFAKHKHVHLHNVAVLDTDDEIEFHISSNDGESSSIGVFDEKWVHSHHQDIKMTRTIKVPCINLLRFVEDHQIEYIDDYISDIQGMDLTVLKTLKPLVDQKRIGSITCEVTKNEFRNAYKDLPDNTENGFQSLLKDNYTLVAKGRTFLSDGIFDAIPKKVWEMDCKWQKK